MTIRFALSLVCLTGCLEELGPALGPEVPACVAEDSDPTTAVTYQADIVGGVLMRKCYRCHTPGGTTPIGIQQAGFDMSTYASLRAGGTRSQTDVIVTGDSCRSILVQKIGEAPPFGMRMPRGGPFLDESERQRISDWIVEGALEN